MRTYTHMHTDRQTHTLLWIKHGRQQAGLEKSVSSVDFYFHFYKEFCVTVRLEMPMDASKQPAKNLLPLPLRQTCIRLHTNQVQNQAKCSVRRCLDAAPPCSIAPRPGTDPTLAAKTITTHACTHTVYEMWMQHNLAVQHHSKHSLTKEWEMSHCSETGLGCQRQARLPWNLIFKGGSGAK